MSIADLDLELQSLRLARDDLLDQRSEYIRLTYDIKTIYDWIKAGILEINLIEERNEEGELLSSNQEDVELWNAQDIKFASYLAYFELSELDFIKQLVRAGKETRGGNPFEIMRETQELVIRQLTQNISEKDAEINSKKAELIKTMAEYHNINID